jgi:hypothetical protein
LKATDVNFGTTRQQVLQEVPCGDAVAAIRWPRYALA